MKLSAFIKELQKIKKEHGDIQISMLDPEALIEGTVENVEPFLALGGESEDKITDITIVDPVTAESIMDGDGEEQE